MTITFLLCNMTIGFIEISRAEVFKVNLKSDKWYIIPYTKKKSLYGTNKLAHNTHLPYWSSFTQG